MSSSSDSEDSVASGDEMVQEDDVEMEDVDEKAKELKAKLQLDPYDMDSRSQLIAVYSRNGCLDEGVEEREAYLKIAPLPAKMWLDWIKDEKAADTGKERIEALFVRALEEMSSLDIYLEYMQWAIGVSIDYAIEKCEAAVQALGVRVDVGGLVWDTYIDIQEIVLQTKTTEADIAKAKSSLLTLYKRALRVPTLQMKGIWERYLAYAENNPDSDLQSLYDKSANTLKSLDVFETRIAATEKMSDENFAVYNEYLEHELATDDPSRIQSFYERLVCEFSEDENIWYQYGNWCETQLKINSVTAKVFARAVRFANYSCMLWQQALLAFERAGEPAEKIDALWTQAKESIRTADDGRALYRTYIYLLRRRSSADGSNDYTQMAAVLEDGHQWLQEAFGHEWDSHAQYRRNYALQAFTRLSDVQKARKIWEDILASGGGRMAERWLEAVTLERRYGDVSTARKLLYKALNSVSDHPSTVFEYFIQFEREEGTLEELDKALAKVNSQVIHRANRPQKEEPKESKKPKKDDRQNAGKPNKGREDRKRQAEPIHAAPAAKKAAPAQQSSKPAAPAAPAVDKDGFRMPSLPFKSPGAAASVPTTSAVSATAAANGETKFTLFVSNLDFKVTADKVQEVLPGAIEVRLAFKGVSTLNRGFGYVDFDSESSMKRALTLDKTPIDGRPMFVSENNPEKRVGFKYETGLEKSKLFVRNVHFDCTNEQLKEVFTQFGEVRDARIVTHKSGKSKGIAYVDFVSEESAKKALEATEIVLLDKKLSVALSNPPKKNDESRAAIAEAAGQLTTRHSSMIQLVPRNVKKPAATTNGNATTGAKMSNDQFRQFLTKK